MRAIFLEYCSTASANSLTSLLVCVNCKASKNCITQAVGSLIKIKLQNWKNQKNFRCCFAFRKYFNRVYVTANSRDSTLAKCVGTVVVEFSYDINFFSLHNWWAVYLMNFSEISDIINNIFSDITEKEKRLVLWAIKRLIARCSCRMVFVS